MAVRVGTDAAGAAETILTLAVLLQAGVTPLRAWGHLAASGDTIARGVCARTEEGAPLVASIARAGGVDATVPRGRPRPRSFRSQRRPRPPDPWPEIAAAWEVATTTGAPLADSLRSLASTVRDTGEAADDVRIALAEPAATARLMGWLPLIAVLLGVALGFDTVGTLLSNPIGIACLVAGAGLIVASQRWNAALVRRARVDTGVPGLEAELLAIALSGGVSIERARSIVTRATALIRTPGSSKATHTTRAALSATADVLALSRTAGVPAVELLRAAATLARHRARVDARLRAARLSTRLLLPLGVCTLPAFLLLGVAPMLLSVMRTIALPV